MSIIKNSSLDIFGEYVIDKPIVRKIKDLFYAHFEKILVCAIVIITALTHYFVVNKITFLNIYFLPTLVAGYIMGRRGGVSVAVFSVAVVSYFVVMSPSTYIGGAGKTNFIFDLTLWACFLILTSIVVGSLYEQNKEKTAELRDTYEGVLEILAKFIDSADQYTKGHSQRVAELSTEMAIRMDLPDRQTETIRVAALLHDIGKVDVSTEVILKAAKLSMSEINELKTHVQKGEIILKPFKQLFRDAVTIIMAHHRYYDNSGYGSEEIPLDKYNSMSLGILTIADAYDAMISDRPYRTGKTPREAVHEIKKLAGKQFDPKLVKKFIGVMKDRLEES